MVCEFHCYSQGSTGVTYTKTDRPGALKQIPMKLTTQEKQAGLLNESNLDLAIQLLQDEGFVVIEDALPQPWVEDMRAVVNAELESRYAGDEDA